MGLRSLEIKKIGTGSVFRFLFVSGIILGLPVNLLLICLGVAVRNLGMETSLIGSNNLLEAGAVVTGVIFLTLAYGLILGLAGIIGAFIYNLVATLAGGIVIRVREE